MKSEQQDTSNAAPKMPRFMPKIPARKIKKPVAAKVEPSETKNSVIDKDLLEKLNSAKSEGGFRGRFPKTERKSVPVQVAFGQGNSSLIRSFGNPKGIKGEDGSDAVDLKFKEYVEPYDYVRSNYPVTLPLRRPYSGDPEILDKEEFGEDSFSRDMPVVTPAAELDLMETSKEPKMLLFQFPSALPLAKNTPVAAESKGDEDKSDPVNVANKGSGTKLGPSSSDSKSGGGRPVESKKGCTLKDLPAGFVGKMLIYRSGKIKMKIGESLFNVSAGVDSMFAQDAAVINVKEKHCCIIGDLPKRAVVTPDIDSLLESMNNL